MIEAWKELPEITRKRIAETSAEVLEAVQRAVGALADAVRKGIRDEAPFEGRLNGVAERMVHHPVAEGRGGDEPTLRLVDEETGVGPWKVGAGLEFGPKREEIFFQPVLESGHVAVAALSASGVTPGVEQVGPGTELVKGFQGPDSMGFSDDKVLIEMLGRPGPAPGPEPKARGRCYFSGWRPLQARPGTGSAILRLGPEGISRLPPDNSGRDTSSGPA